MDARTLTRYRKTRVKMPMLPARYALACARRGPHAEDWESDGREGYTRKVEGFTITLTAPVESVYPMEGDGLGSYVQEAGGDSYTWGGNYPEPENGNEWPLGLPYTAFRWEGCNQRGDSGYFLPDGIEERYADLRANGQSRSVAWDMTRQWVEETVSEFFNTPLTYCVVRVTASRAGVELGSASLGTNYLDDADGHAHLFECADEHGLVDDAIAEARETLTRCNAGRWETVATYDGGELESEDDDAFDTFTLSMDMGNAAMESASDVADALRTAANLLDAGHESHHIRDENGNTVGKWELT